MCASEEMGRLDVKQRASLVTGGGLLVTPPDVNKNYDMTRRYFCVWPFG